jgi:hypothetical protein
MTQLLLDRVSNICFNTTMSSVLKNKIDSNRFQDNKTFFHEQSKNLSEAKRVNLTDLVARMNQERKIEKKNNIILSAAAISAVTVLGIILTL